MTGTTIRECAEELLAWMKAGSTDRAHDFPNNLADLSTYSWFGHEPGQHLSFVSKYWNELPEKLQDFCILAGACAFEDSYGRVPPGFIRPEYIFDGPESDREAPRLLFLSTPGASGLPRTTFRLEEPLDGGEEHFAVLANVAYNFMYDRRGCHPHGTRHELNLWTYLPKEKAWKRDGGANTRIQKELRKALSWLRTRRMKLLGVTPEKRVPKNTKHIERLEKAMKFQETNHEFSAKLRELRAALDALLEVTDKGLMSLDKVENFASQAKDAAETGLGITYKHKLLTGENVEDARTRVERSLLGKHPTKD